MLISIVTLLNALIIEYLGKVLSRQSSLAPSGKENIATFSF
jgi:hypothetical protein